MWPEPQQLGAIICTQTGLSFEASAGTDHEGRRWYALRPSELPEAHTFTIHTMVEWRRLKLAFELGTFARELLSEMNAADVTGRTAFQAILEDCERRGAKVDMHINGRPENFSESGLWSLTWKRFSLALDTGPLELGTEDDKPAFDIIRQWTGRFAAAIVAILPLEENEAAASSFEEKGEVFDAGVTGYPEGALKTVKVNGYERDRRNRAAAISIHGAICKACGVDLGERYGPVASGYVEIHHVTPVSELGSGYSIDPARDLTPLCPNCHAIAHKRHPPFTVEEITRLLNTSRNLG